MRTVTKRKLQNVSVNERLLNIVNGS